MPLYGDLQQIALARATIKELAGLPSKVAVRVAAALTKELQRMFKEERDPYGNAWAELAEATVRKKGHDTILYEKGELQDGTKATPAPGAGVRIHIGPKGYFHQVGRENMPARKLLPEYGLPAKWRAIIRREVERALREAKRK